jgi:hypothetical protein
MAAVHLTGGHWGVLQVVAWANMLRTYTQEKGLVEGVKDTFDGEHPCPLCHHIEKAQQEEQKQIPVPTKELEKLVKWFGAAPETGEVALTWSHQMERRVFSAPSQLRSQWSGRPPYPPPRARA